MKLRNYILMSVMVVAAIACTPDNTEDNAFSTEPISLNFGPEGGVETHRITSNARWIASTDNAWIVVSPANGRGTTECQFIIDSTLVADTRNGVVRIQNLDTWEEKEIRISQAGFPYTIEVEKREIEIENYKNYGERYFDVKIRSNVEFKTKISDGATWLSNEDYKLNLNRGVRPREVSLRFKWDINTSDRSVLRRLSSSQRRPWNSPVTTTSTSVRMLPSQSSPTLVRATPWRCSASPARCRCWRRLMPRREWRSGAA